MWICKLDNEQRLHFQLYDLVVVGLFLLLVLLFLLLFLLLLLMLSSKASGNSIPFFCIDLAVYRVRTQISCKAPRACVRTNQGTHTCRHTCAFVQRDEHILPFFCALPQWMLTHSIFCAHSTIAGAWERAPSACRMGEWCVPVHVQMRA